MEDRVTYPPSVPYLSSTLVAPSITEPSIFGIGPQSLSITGEVIPSNTCSLAAHVYQSLSLSEVSCLTPQNSCLWALCFYPFEPNQLYPVGNGYRYLGAAFIVQQIDHFLTHNQPCFYPWHFLWSPKHFQEGFLSIAGVA